MATTQINILSCFTFQQATKLRNHKDEIVGSETMAKDSLFSDIKQNSRTLVLSCKYLTFNFAIIESYKTPGSSKETFTVMV